MSKVVSRLAVPVLHRAEYCIRDSGKYLAPLTTYTFVSQIDVVMQYSINYKVRTRSSDATVNPLRPVAIKTCSPKAVRSEAVRSEAV